MEMLSSNVMEGRLNFWLCERACVLYKSDQFIGKKPQRSTAFWQQNTTAVNQIDFKHITLTSPLNGSYTHTHAQHGQAFAATI